MLRSRLLVIAVSSCVVLAAACSSDGDDDGNGGTVSVLPPVSVTSTSLPEASVTTAAPTTTTPAPPTGRPEAEDAAQVLYESWVADDRAGAATVAEPEAIDAVWAAVPGPYELYRGCDTGEFDTGGCLFRDRSTNHTIQMSLERRGDNWVVTGAFFSES